MSFIRVEKYVVTLTQAVSFEGENTLRRVSRRSSLDVVTVFLVREVASMEDKDGNYRG